MKDFYITQSMYKDWIKYKNDRECGGLFFYKWVNGWSSKDTEAQVAGWWFEDMLIRGKSDIQPPLLKGGGLNVTYRQLESHLPLSKEMLADEGKILSSNVDVIKGIVKGKPDLTVEKNGVKKRIDIKTTAHIANKYDFYGWGALGEPSDSYRYINQKEDKIVQAKTYLFLDTDYKCDIFEWWVFSSKDDTVLRFSYVPTADELRQHQFDLEDAYEEIIGHLEEESLELKPEYKRCFYCPLKKECVSFQKFPNVKRI